MSAARKRPRVENNEDNRAECPFSVRVVDPKDKEQKKKKRRRTDGAEEDDSAPKIQLQMSPFAPSGKFKTFETMDIHFQVEPTKRWTDMTRYNSFVLNGIKYFSEGFIYVANESSIERQKAVASKEQQPYIRKKSDDDWVARILEIRASDEHHVYARIYWMYWPDELPQGTQDSKRSVQGRQPYHGINELIASNHMDIINVVSVTSPATVNQWFEENDDEVQNALYWRQAFDVRTYELTTVEHICKCGEPGNPDRTLIGCTSEPCKKWLHEECIKKEALQDVYKRLGTDKPHIAAGPVKEEKDVEEDSKRPLSPTETGTATNAQHSIDVKADGDGESDTLNDANGTIGVKQADDEDAPTAPEDATDASSLEPKAEKMDIDSETKVTPNKPTPGRRPGRPAKVKKPELNGDSKPWDGLFEVTLRMDLSPPMLEFKDLREDVQGGEKTWTEPIKCLVCGTQIN